MSSPTWTDAPPNYVFAPADLLASDHPLLALMPDTARLFWVGSPEGDQRFGYVWGARYSDAQRRLVSPDYVSVEEILRQTLPAAHGKRTRREQRQYEIRQRQYREEQAAAERQRLFETNRKRAEIGLPPILAAN